MICSFPVIYGYLFTEISTENVFFMIFYLLQSLTWSTSATTYNYVQDQGLLVLKTNKIHINMYINKLGVEAVYIY